RGGLPDLSSGGAPPSAGISEKVNERGRFCLPLLLFQSSGYQYYLLVSARRWLNACEANEILPARQGHKRVDTKVSTLL
ncbi:MAG: hypothetical protein ACLT4C_03930, partial [Butyricicoccus sp.]